MSWNPILDPSIPIGDAVDSIETVIVPRARDIGGFEVRRALPVAHRRMVGPFIFFDQMGPVEFLTGQGIDVRPHPHIGLGTITYLLKGRLHHRDSLGTDQWIEPGAVNWMLAGNGITHSERMDGTMRQQPNPLFGVQTWLGLPEAQEDDPAQFLHAGRADLPVLEGEGKEVRVVLGAAWGAASPVALPVNAFFAEARLAPGAAIPSPEEQEDGAAYVLEGGLRIGRDSFEAGRMVVFRPGDRLTLQAGPEGAHLLLLGGDVLEGHRYIWWNFVSSSKEKIEAAKEAWRAGDWTHGRFRLPPGDDAEFVPLPGPKRPA
ncbi:pirin family protein [Pseudooceanicola nanhaiensis]|uniref:pirin family protein n=1 Tax=Pseudooceanicola nanhaiensis TaxID=375761 RepID=UPI001CD7676A|nr:pirin family protein [Pseudooceanicola nanhaiensis]MCA0920978.1 pirin family protein [Pseudooceanicola nanhaiensis]